MEHERALTALFNDHLAGVANAILGVFHITAKNPQRPWDDALVTELLVVALLVIAVAMLRASLSVDKPGKLQHVFEMLHGFFKTTVDEVGLHHGGQYIPYIGTIFLFILSMNLIAT